MNSWPLPANIESLRATVNGRPIHYLKAGSGRPVVLVHGGASAAAEWRPVMSRCADRFSFYAPDLPGFGASARDAKGYYLPDYAEFLLGFIALLKLEKPALVGHSFGGRACLDAAGMDGGKISRLILIDTSGLGKMSLFGSFLFNFFVWLRKVLRRPQPFPAFLTKEGVDWNYVGDAALQNIKMPVLLIWKSPDPYLSVNQAKRALKLIPGAELAIIPGYGHAPHQQKDNRLFRKLMLDFLEREDGRQG